MSVKSIIYFSRISIIRSNKRY